MSEGTNSAATRRSYNKRERGDVIERNEGERETRLDSTKSSPTTVPLRLFFFLLPPFSLFASSLSFFYSLFPQKKEEGNSCVSVCV